MKRYKLIKDSIQHQFMQSRAPIQMLAGGFANGKSAAGCIKMLGLAKDYPGGNFLIARSTLRKLEDTVLLEFFKWLPDGWKAPNGYVKGNGNPTLKLSNGSVINFRYLSQQGKNNESSTSNLLSATYDAAFVDQIEDPEITHKDFLDLLGRMRGSARYVGTDPSMPAVGPGWIILDCNPTRNWVYTELAKPRMDYDVGIANERLLADTHGNPLIELFQGSTYTNKDNIPEQYLKNLEAMYKGQMRSRFLLGQWEAYEGLVYPMFDDRVHVVRHQYMHDLFEEVRPNHRVVTVEAFDYGLSVPSCYLFSFVDPYGNVHVLDGFYETGLSVDEQAHKIKAVRNRYLLSKDGHILADPAIFNRIAGSKAAHKRTIASMFLESNIMMTRADNDVINGITKVQSYLHKQEHHQNPYTGEFEAPYIYISDKLSFMRNEIADYYWRKDTSNQYMDKPMDRNDHSMDALKYLLSQRPRVSTLYSPVRGSVPSWMYWQIDQSKPDTRAHRHR